MHDFKQLYPIHPYDPNMKSTPTRWLVDGIWQLGKINGMAGFEKSGKSRLMNWILVGMSAGTVLGCAAMPQKVLYLCGEETKDVVNARIKRYAELQGIPEKMFEIDFMEAAGMRLDLKPVRNDLIATLIDGSYEMLVVDPWRRVHGADEDKSTVMSPIYNDMRKWSNRYSLTMVILHHTPKLSLDTDMDRMASWFRGSTDLPAILDTAQYVDRETKNKISVRRQGRFPPLDPFKVIDLGGKTLGDDRGFERAS